MCKYCNDGKYNYDDMNKEIAKMKIKTGEIEVINNFSMVYIDGNTLYLYALGNEKTARINFCPMCGMDLSKVDDE